jgi:hypothetical protein
MKNADNDFLQKTHEEILSYCKENNNEAIIVMAFEKFEQEPNRDIRFHFQKNVLFFLPEQNDTYRNLLKKAVALWK